MGTDVSRDRLSGLLVPSQSAAVSAAFSSYSQAGPRPGVPDPVNVTDAVLAATGEMVAAADYTVQTIRGGFPGAASAGAFVWKQTSDTATEYRGWNPPQAISGWEAPVWTDGSGTLISTSSPHAIALADGTVLAATQIEAWLASR